MKRNLLPLATLLLFGVAAQAQVGIGTLAPHASTQLEVVSNNKGIMIPRVALTGTTDSSTINRGNVNSLLVFNTTENSEIQAGYYYWLTDKWIRLVSSDQVGSLKNTVNVSIAIVGDELILTDSDQNTVRMPWVMSELVRNNETITQLHRESEGKYIYYNEASFDANGVLIPGTTGVVIDVITDITNNFEEILNEETIKNIFNEYIKNLVGNVTFDGDEFHYYDGENHQTINITEMVKNAETITKLEVLGDGKYVYYNESAIDTAGNPIPALGIHIDVVSDITNNFEEILNEEIIKNLFEQYIKNIKGNVTFDGDNFIYIDQNGVEQTVNITQMVKDAQTITKLEVLGDGKYVYYNESAIDTAGNPIPALGIHIDVVSDITNNFEEILNEEIIKNLFEQYIKNIKGNVTFDGDNFIYIDENGVEQTVNITQMVRDAQTITNLEVLGDGKYVYYNESAYDAAGNAIPALGIHIDVLTDVTNNFEDILSEEVIKNFFEQYIKNIKGNVTFDGDNFIYIDQNGDQQIVNIEEMVKGYETLTALAHVVTQVDNGSGEMVDVHTLTYTDEKGIANAIDLQVLVKGTETITEMTYDAVTHVLSYKNEKGIIVNFDLVDLVGDVETLTKLELDIDNKKLVYTDENLVTHNLDLAMIVQEPWYNVATNQGAVSNTDNIYTQGWVGIGFTEPSDVPDEKLRVNGTITTVSSHYADYVFEDYFDGFSTLKYDYKFKDLETIAAFIKTNRHLPGITPIGDLTQTNVGYSFNMSELSIQLLEKTEELYLHLIDQKKFYDEKNKEIIERLEKLESLLSK